MCLRAGRPPATPRRAAEAFAASAAKHRLSTIAQVPWRARPAGMSGAALVFFRRVIAADEFGIFQDRMRPPHQVTLDFVAGPGCEKIELSLGLDTFGQHRQVQRPRRGTRGREAAAPNMIKGRFAFRIISAARSSEAR